VHERANDLMLAASERRQIDANLASAAWFPGAELFLPYLCDRTSWLGEYLPPGAPVFVLDPPAVDAALDALALRLEEAESAAREAGSFFPEVERLYVDPPALRRLLERRPLVELVAERSGEWREVAGDRVWSIDARGNDGLAAARAQVRERRGEQRFSPMVRELESYRAGGSKLVVLASDATQLDRLEHLLGLCAVRSILRVSGFPAALAAERSALCLVLGHLQRGFRLEADGLVVVTDEEIFGQRRRSSRRRKVAQARLLTALNEIKPGDYMVHVDHGIGIYRGLKHIVAGGTEGDFIHLEYAGGDRYYLPVDRINLVEKYTGSGSSAPPLSRLGAPAWTRTKQRAKESILKLAHELLDVEAFRAVHTREPFAAVGADFEEFEARFPFEETDGQKVAIADIARDLLGEKPMDRLVCGDVGYGKTEVAVRAAYLTVMAGKQVAFLVPTTVLARQHFDTLRKRFDGYPVRVAMLSRFQTRAANHEVAAGLASGEVDVVVGTHRLLQRDVDFGRLGLLVVDEEHRFGVKAKERIKKLRREVDVLTMTATPIPRTLQLALSGVRDLSLIETPPVDRLAIRTYVARYDEGLIKQSVDREIARGGQVFFVHNRVASIEAVARRLQELVPRARLAVAHGQMDEGDLEERMLAFLGGEIDVLVCTAIIESGLDIPNANTIVINRADTFGLAQLYQIRGRVGRSHRRAYAYLLVPGEQIITDEARRRLEVLQELDDLGSGFRIAAHDMEIRGAGNLLGKEQSGHVAAVGFELFMQLMEEATREIRGESGGLRIEPEIELSSEAYLPEGYIDDVGERLLLYKRMANAASPDVLREIAEELADRFGPLPPQVEDFLRIMALRPALKRLAVESLKASEHGISLRFHPQSPVDPELLVRLATEQPARFRVRPGGVLTMRLAGSEGGAEISWDAMVDRIEALLAQLSADGVGRQVESTGGPGRGALRTRVEA
jgi:transcription-repair coupling factor (superfamily II helicase)